MNWRLKQNFGDLFLLPGVSSNLWVIERLCSLHVACVPGVEMDAVRVARDKVGKQEGGSGSFLGRTIVCIVWQSDMESSYLRDVDRFRVDLLILHISFGIHQKLLRNAIYQATATK